MPVYIRKLKDASGNTILPATRAEAVYVGDLKQTNYITVHVNNTATEWKQTAGAQEWTQTLEAVGMKSTYQIWDARATMTATPATNILIQQAASCIAHIQPLDSQVKITCHDDYPRTSFDLAIGVKSNQASAATLKNFSLASGSSVAVKMRDKRTFTCNLASTTPGQYDGTGNVSLGVTGILPVANGGSGLSAQPSMRVNLASTSADTIFKASPAPGVNGVLAVANGGTGGATKSAALTNLGLQLKLTGTTLTITHTTT